MMRASRWSAAALLTISLAACAQGRETDTELLFDEMLGGETTAMSSGSNAFELSARNLSNEERRTFEVGDSFFNQNWVTAPASTTARDGLGPTFNALSCSSCHSHDGRAKPPESDDDPERGLLLRLSVPGPDGPVDEPVYGGQLQDRAILGVLPEGRISIRYEGCPRSVPGRDSVRPAEARVLDLGRGLRPAAPGRDDFAAHSARYHRHGAARGCPRRAHPGIGRPGRRGRRRHIGPRQHGVGRPQREPCVGAIRVEGQPAYGGAADRRRLPRRHRHHLHLFPTRTARRRSALVRTPPAAASPSCRTNASGRWCSTCRRSPCPRCATWTTRRCAKARSSSRRRDVPLVTLRGTLPGPRTR